MTEYAMLLDLCESQLIPSHLSLKKWPIKILNELGYLYFLALRILLSSDDTKTWAENYCKRVARSDFEKWRSDGNDFYVLLYAVSNEEENAKSSISPRVVRDWLNHAGTPQFDAYTQRLFNRLDAMFRIDNSTLKTSRRLIMHWSQTDAREREDLIDKLIVQIKKLGPRSELLDHLKRLSKQYSADADDTVYESDLSWLKNRQDKVDELSPHLIPAMKMNDQMFVGQRGKTHDDVYNKNYDAIQAAGGYTESPTNGFYDPRTKVFYTRRELGDLDSTDLMSKLQRMRKYSTEGIDQDCVIESASSGATGAASVATAVGGLGAGFDPDATWRGVYGNKPPVVIKRAMKKPPVVPAKS
jgi:hypothetical protein